MRRIGPAVSQCLASAVLAAAMIVLSASFARGQSPAISTSTSIQRLSESFFERIGVGFGFHGSGPGGGFFFRQGGVDSALPPVGGYDGAGEARIGFGVQGSNGGFSLGLAAGQGSSRSLVSQSPSITVANGTVGGFYHGVIRPFVTGIVPVVGGWRTSPLIERLKRLQAESYSNPPTVGGGRPSRERAPASGGPPTRNIASRQASTAQRGDFSVAEIRARQAAEDAARQQEVRALLERAAELQRAGKPGVARIYYQQAASRATGALKQRLEQKIQPPSDSARK